MKLDEYLRKANISMLRLADEVGCHYQTIYNYVNNGRLPSSHLAKKIIDYTKGEVSLDDLLEGVEERRCPKCGQRKRIRTIKKDIVD